MSQKKLTFHLHKDDRLLGENSPSQYDQQSQNSPSQRLPPMDIMENDFEAEKVVTLNNQYSTTRLNPLVYDAESEDEENRDLLDQENENMTEKEKIHYNYRIINQMCQKVFKDKQTLDKKLRSLKENSYETAINWNNDEKLHKEANLATYENKRELIVLKKKKLERLRRDVLNIKDLSDQHDPELYLQIRSINIAKEQYKTVKDLFSTIDLIVNKNSLIGFNWEKFCESVFKNKETVDAFIYKLKYFPFNEMTDYYYTLCKKFTGEDKEFTKIFEQQGNRKVPFEVFVLKTFVEWMEIMKYGYELNIELIESIKNTNTQQLEVDKLQLSTDILEERYRNQESQRDVLKVQVEQVASLLEKLNKLRDDYSSSYNLQSV